MEEAEASGEAGDLGDGQSRQRRDLQIAVGRVVIAGAECESVIYGLAEAVRLGSMRSRRVSDARTAVRKRVEAAGLPTWAECDATEVLDWLDRVQPLLKQRNSVVHSTMSRMMWDGAQFVQVQYSIRDDSMSPLLLEPIQELATELEGAFWAGATLLMAIWWKSGETTWQPVFDTEGNVYASLASVVDPAEYG
ncbi:MAG TPA: hypothetical protein DHV14_11085 [Micrococcales bacterium]|uniref:hypothetical protein n=1 Tax=Miniimonas arenae TaxID=676201 RepID=UPI000ED80CDF|nr:hypothetical protein [Miniimonas arenae]HCX85656.1 hypothetical protein [Micrococcales bacterium]